jgi:hypothetical protein
MHLSRLSPSSGEKIFFTFRNSDATAISAGHWAAIDTVTDQDGVGVDKPAGKLLNKIAGVCMTTLAPGAYGPFQVWGICTIAKAKGSTQTNTLALTAGSPLAIATSGFYPTRFAVTSTAAKAEYAKQGSIGIVMGAHTAANYSAATSSVYDVFVTCFG